ncbi:MAG: hypothetical protein D6731_23675 [Planctomycetota bacterium]|nr:MAG: hypothetical protein D6731_23675 [Planctomycetota bacterium]
MALRARGRGPARPGRAHGVHRGGGPSAPLGGLPGRRRAARAPPRGHGRAPGFPRRLGARRGRGLRSRRRCPRRRRPRRAGPRARPRRRGGPARPRGTLRRACACRRRGTPPLTRPQVLGRGLLGRTHRARSCEGSGKAGAASARPARGRSRRDRGGEQERRGTRCARHREAGPAAKGTQGEEEEGRWLFVRRPFPPRGGGPKEGARRRRERRSRPSARREDLEGSVSVRARPSEGADCPYCRSPCRDGEELVRCGSCGTIQHRECDRELGRCAVCGRDEPRRSVRTT